MHLKTIKLALTAISILFLAPPAFAASPPVNRPPDVQRDVYGHIVRNPAARREFMKHHPCPSTGKTRGACPGYVVDHIKPLKRGGADSPANMQWNSIAMEKAKNRRE